MTNRMTTIREAARGRLAQWARVARSKDGSRSLPGSHRFTDFDIRSAPITFGEADKRLCGSAPETARVGREDVSNISRRQSVRHHLQVSHPHLLGSRFIAWFPRSKGRKKISIPKIKNQRSPDRLLDNTHKS